MSFGYYPLKKGNKYHIRLRYTYSKSSRTDFYPQVVINNIKFFNPESLSQPIRKNTKDADRLNRFLKNYVREIEEIIDTIRYNKKLPTAKLVKERFEAKKLVKMQDANNDAEINQFSVIKTIDAFIKDAAVRVKIGDGLTDSSYEKMNRIMNKWKAYFKEKGNSSIQFEDLNLKLDLFKDFAQWCLNDDNKFANSSINKYSTTFRSFLKWSLRKSFHNINIKKFDSPNLKEVSNHSILALTPDQLKYMFSFDKFNYLTKDGQINNDCYQYKHPKDNQFIIEEKIVYKIVKNKKDKGEEERVKHFTSLEMYRDFFCFLCSTSLSYIDAANLRLADFNEESDCFHLTRIKTKTPITIPMNPMSREIFSKYSFKKNAKGKDGIERPNHYLFPRESGNKFYSNQKCNDALKKIGEIVKDKFSVMVNVEVRSGKGFKDGTEKEVPLYTKLHTHMGRKTFVSFAFSEKISPMDIKKITGHSNEKMFKFYLNSLRDEVKEEFQSMKAFITDDKFLVPYNKRGDKAEPTKEEMIRKLIDDNDNGLIDDVEFKKQMKELIKL
jgi:integrase